MIPALSTASRRLKQVWATCRARPARQRRNDGGARRRGLRDIHARICNRCGDRNVLPANSAARPSTATPALVPTIPQAAAASARRTRRRRWRIRHRARCRRWWSARCRRLRVLRGGGIAGGCSVPVTTLADVADLGAGLIPTSSPAWLASSMRDSSASGAAVPA